jgi:hypothetical protein
MYEGWRLAGPTEDHILCSCDSHYWSCSDGIVLFTCSIYCGSASPWIWFRWLYGNNSSVAVRDIRSGAQRRLCQCGRHLPWIGVTLALLLDFAFYFVTGSTVSWRFPFAIQIVLLLMVAGFTFTLPESPR